MTDQETYNELLAIREMAQMVVKNADRVIRELQPVSTGSSKKIRENYLMQRTKVKIRRQISKKT